MIRATLATEPADRVAARLSRMARAASRPSGVSRRDAARQIADAFGIARNAAYQLVASL